MRAALLVLVVALGWLRSARACGCPREGRLMMVSTGRGDPRDPVRYRQGNAGHGEA